MKLAIILIFFYHAVHAAERVVTSSLAEVQSFVAKKVDAAGADAVLVVFDFDNTLMAMNNDLGSDQWYQWQSSVIKNGDKKQMMASNRSELFDLHYKLFALGDMHTVEKETSAIVKQIQGMKVKSFILTSRGSELRNDTEIELDRGAMDFSGTAPGPAGGYPERFLPEGIESARFVSYQKGILMGSGQNKGLLLKAFLKKTGSAFKSIIVVDDTLKNIENIEAEYKDDKSVTLFYYTHEEARVKKFETDKTQVWKEWKALKPVLDLYKKQNSLFAP
ncbi:MAG: outer membrane protein [Pseudobdellovibrio sp.]|jgi:hypothetical protein|nr:outer membrane protein [Pseudobdellovibrio sp.]